MLCCSSICLFSSLFGTIGACFWKADCHRSQGGCEGRQLAGTGETAVPAGGCALEVSCARGLVCVVSRVPEDFCAEGLVRRRTSVREDCKGLVFRIGLSNASEVRHIKDMLHNTSCHVTSPYERVLGAYGNAADGDAVRSITSGWRLKGHGSLLHTFATEIDTGMLQRGLRR